MATLVQTLLSYRVGRVAVAGAVAYAVTEMYPELLHEKDGTLKFPGLLEQNAVVMGAMFAAWKWWTPDLVPAIVGVTAFSAVTNGLPSGGSIVGSALLRE